MKTPKPKLQLLHDEIVTCRRCPRLVEYRENVPPKPAFSDQSYWRRPLPGFGDPKAWLLIVGLAPAAHGGNRTGRIFTGDGTSQFLVRALHQAGFANQPFSTALNDGLKYHGCYLTAAVKCAPPGDKPTREECLTCNDYFQTELSLLKHLTHVLVLGKFAFDGFLLAMKAQGHHVKGLKFSHGASYQLDGSPLLLYASYHPSPQNTNTGKLKEQEFLEILFKMKNEHDR